MPTSPPSRRNTGRSAPDCVSCRRISRIERPPYPPPAWPPGAGGRVPAAMPTSSPADRLAKVEAAFRSLPERYLGADPGFDALYHIRLGDIGRVWEVRVTTHGARVRTGHGRRRPDVNISTDSATWLRLRQGR